MDGLGIELISAIGLPPVEFVGLAADLGCQYISIGLTQPPDNPLGYPAWSLRDDPVLRREVIAAMRDRDVCVSLGEGFIVRPNVDVRDFAADLDLMCELGGGRINTVGIDADVGRTLDQLGILVDMAEKVGMETTLEFVPGLPIGDLSAAVDAIRHVGRPTFRLLIDTMHLVRSGSGASDLAALDPDIIGYAQLCDVPLAARHDDYGYEALYERLAPGAGELPLPDIVAALPRDVVLGLEVPMLAAAKAGIGPHERLGRCVDAARGLLAKLDNQ